MPTNLRSIPIEGYITDNAGNIIRNATVVIKEDTPSGSNIIDTVKSDDEGYFISRPIKNGIYDIYESGVRIYRQYHSSQPTVLQCYNPGDNNVPNNLAQFSEFTSSDIPTGDINTFRTYIQIEPETLNTALYGHQFPLWNIGPYDTGLADNGHPFTKLINVHTELTSLNLSRLTHTRFDVEYFAPLYAQNSVHRKIRWAGIPGVIFYSDSKIVLPLDYFSLVPAHFHTTLKASSDSNFQWNIWNGDNTLIEIILDLSSASQSTYASLSTGDILELSFWLTPTTVASEKFWCILYYKKPGSGANPSRLYAKMLKSSYTSHEAQGVTDLDYLITRVFNINKITSYQGMFNGIQNITQSTSEYFTVSENLQAQSSEIYNYNKA